MSIEEIKKKSILDVAADLGVPLRRVSSTVYERTDHDSFKIFTNTNTFKWFSRDIQGDVINFVQLIQDVPFDKAAYYLQHGEFKQVDHQEIKKEPFSYFLQPYEKTDFKEGWRYLSKERSLSDETISFFRQQGVMAEAVKKTNAYFEPVIVFKSLDRTGKMTGASLQGIRENFNLYDRGRLKQIMKNSDGQMGMSVTIGKPIRLVFIESPIDLMSYFELNRDKLSDVRLVAMDGLKESTISRYAVELIGEMNGKDDFIDNISPSKMKSTLETVIKTTQFFQNNPDFITLAVDNDEAGQVFIDKLKEKGLPIEIDLPPSQFKDWNDLLKSQKEADLLQSRSTSLNQMIMEAKEELKEEQITMDTIYDYSSKADSLYGQPALNQDKFAFLLAHCDNAEVYNSYAIQSDYETEMMAVTHLYNEYNGDKGLMVDAATERGLLQDKMAFLKQYSQDFIKPQLTSERDLEV